MDASIWDSKHEVNSKPVAYISKDSYELLNDSQFNYLLWVKGVDVTRKLRIPYNEDSISSLVPVFYDD